MKRDTSSWSPKIVHDLCRRGLQRHLNLAHVEGFYFGRELASRTIILHQCENGKFNYMNEASGPLPARPLDLE